MKATKFLLLTVCTVLASAIYAQQPYGGCWHVEYVANWSPETDEDAKFNRSLVKLQPRIDGNEIKANDYQYPDALIGACLTMNPMCSTTPSQGANNFIGYNPTYWQYMDLVVWWGGSAGEGIIIPPSAPFTDICHMNGVKVLGNVFFPPRSYSGDPAWVTEFLKQENGAYPYAEKMYEIAKYYGFDGWFLNEETYASTNAQWEAWMEYFYQVAHADGNYDMHLQWYDATYSVADVVDMLNIDDNVSFMVNYGAATSGYIASNRNSYTSGTGKSEEQFFAQVYSGLEMAQGGLNGNASNFQNALPSTGHNISLQLFNPEENIWKTVVEDLLDTENASGQQAYTAINTVFSNESRVWVNPNGDPSNTSYRDNNTLWPGLANAILERSVIQTKPFVTSFSGGQGKYRFVEGEKQGTQDWYHRGMQSILPTWRWWVESASSSDNLSFAMDWDDAYNIGTSILVTGNVTANSSNLVRLYKTALEIESGDKFQLVYKTSTANSIQLKLGIEENNNAFTAFELTSSTTVNGWTVAEVDLSSLAGKTVSIIALDFTSPSTVSNYEARLGQLGIIPSSYSQSLTVSNLTVENELGEETADLRITWDAPSDYDSHVDHFDVYVERNGTKTLVGQTRDEAFYVPRFTREDNENSLVVSVVTVTKDMKQGQEVSTTVEYPEMTLPVVSIVASPTLAKTGEQVTLTAEATNKPQSYSWVLPEGATLVSQSDNTATVTFSEEGLYSITVRVTNEVGTTEKVETDLVEVSNDLTLENVALNKTIYSVSGELSSSGEVATNILDGKKEGCTIHEKWCVGGSKEHWVIIDLEQPYKLYEFVIYDAQTNEAGTDNLDSYIIELSNDLLTWNEAVNTTGRKSENIHYDWIKPTVARYIRFVPYDADAPITIRIWEFEAYGTESTLQLSTIAPQTMDINSTLQVTGNFALGSEGQEDNFSIEATSDAPEVVDVTSTTVNESAGTYTLTLSSSTAVNVANITVALTNGDYVVYTTFQVTVNDPSTENLVSGIVPTFTQTGSNLTTPSDKGELKNITDGDYTSYYAPDINETAESQSTFIFPLNGNKELSNLVLLLDYEDSEVAEYVAPTAISVEVSSDGSTYTEWASLETSREIRVTPETTATATHVALNVTTPFFATTKILEFELYGTDASGIDDVNTSAAVVVAPTVVKSGENIMVSGEEIERIEIVSLQGMLVKSFRPESNYTTVNTGGLAKGTYLMVVNGKGYVKTVKVIVN